MKPQVIEIFGDKHTKPEPEQHRICFPGGEIHVDRTSDGEYWAHLYVNTPERHEYTNGDFSEGHMISKTGKITDSRIDYNYSEYSRRVDNDLPLIPSVENAENAYHIAFRIALN